METRISFAPKLQVIETEKMSVLASILGPIGGAWRIITGVGGMIIGFVVSRQKGVVPSVSEIVNQCSGDIAHPPISAGSTTQSGSATVVPIN